MTRQRGDRHSVTSLRTVLHCRIGDGEVVTQLLHLIGDLLDVREEGLLIVPNATSATLQQVGVEAPLPLGLACVIPHLLLIGRDDGDRETHPIGTTHSSDPMDEIGRIVGKRHVDDVWKALHV